MAFEELRERLKDQAAEALAKIQETSAYNTLRERYEGQTPLVQKVIVGGGIALLIVFLLMFPMGYMTSSSEYLTQFEENRELIQGLLRASRSAKAPMPLPPPMSADMIRGSVDSSIRQAGLIPEQIGEMNPIPENELKGLAPPGVTVNGLAVTLKKLNVNQVIEIGNMIQNTAGAGNKMLGVDILQSAGTTHYYDMVIRLVNFGIPAVDAGGGADDGGGSDGKPPPRRGSKSSDSEAGGE